MKVPDKIILKKIIRKNLYYDKKSKNPHLDTTKPKYKLAGNCLLENYFFHILTRTKDACKKSCSVSFIPSDWEEISENFKRRLTICYCDLTKYEILSEELLLEKIKDADNGFNYVSRVSESKFIEIQTRGKKITSNPHISPATKKIIKAGISDSIDELLLKLDI